MRSIRIIKQFYVSTYIGCLASHLSGTCAWLQPVFQEPGASRLIAVDSSIRSTTRLEAPPSDCTRSPDEISTIGFPSSNWPEQISDDDRRRAAAAALGEENTCVTLNGSGIQLAVGPQPLWLRNHNSGPAQRIMVKRLATSPHDPLGITDSACKNQSVVEVLGLGCCMHGKVLADFLDKANRFLKGVFRRFGRFGQMLDALNHVGPVEVPCCDS
ncbi:protein ACCUMULATION AND REPLICATION OF CHLOROPLASTS 3 [Dorcoceras hygrometricum]|uniref:Protein ACCUMULATION AND REPLICATION OF CHLOROPLASTS 3 n=1 Tax=Dorcoceras hygrometricum TaxID=472368 RepID=A0A2Z7A421_9LAMI|nr:protein ACCUMULATION AND REPLICATION OF CHLOROPLASTS 3 [Dorcoceras hygrometricum]